MIIYIKQRSLFSGAVDMMPDPKLLKRMEHLMLSTSSSPQLRLLQRRKDVQHLLTISFLIKSYELGSKSDGMNQHNFFFPLSLVMLEGKTPVLTLLGKVPVVPVARERLHLIADTNRNSCTVLWGTENGPTGL